MGRVERVAEQLKVEVSRILLEELKDPRLGFVTVMHADISADLQHAHVSVSCLGTEEERASTLAALTQARGFIRKLIGQRIRLRYTPELTFHLDRSLDAQFRIQETLNRLHKEHPTS